MVMTRLNKTTLIKKREKAFISLAEYFLSFSHFSLTPGRWT